MSQLIRDLGRIEACSIPAARVIQPRRGWRAFGHEVEFVTQPEQGTYPGNMLLQAAYIAFSQHRPLVLSPDIIWLTIAQGLATHINMHSAQLRDRLVAHEGRQVLHITTQRPFDKRPHPWDGYIENFSLQLRHHLRPAVHDLFVADFSTTGPVERLASQVALMDGMKAYFGYELSECGIPSITLEGTSEDWCSLGRRVKSFDRLGLGWWQASLLPVLAQFVRASRGDVDPGFWRDLYQQMLPGPRGGYHGPVETFSGWIGRLFPYTAEGTRNPLLEGRTATIGDFRPGICQAPLVWRSPGVEVKLDLMAGLLAIEQAQRSLALRPRIGWVVRQSTLAGLN